jgi:hypothetical protein
MPRALNCRRLFHHKVECAPSLVIHSDDNNSEVGRGQLVDKSFHSFHIARGTIAFHRPVCMTDA